MITLNTHGVSSHLLLSSGMLILWQKYFLIPYITTDSSYHFISMAVSHIPLIPPSSQPKSVHKHNSNSSIKSALLQYCPAANAKCFKYYKTAKNFSAYSSKRKKLSTHPQLQGSRGAVSPSHPLYKYLHF